MKSRFVLNVICVAISVVSMTTSVLAAVISADYPGFGVGSITRDTDQNLDFLDLTFSFGRSSDDISTQFGPGGDFQGFRYATEIEVINLINNFGFIPNALPGQQTNGTTGTDQLAGLIELLGGVPEFTSKKASGITGTATTSTLGGYPGLRLTTILTFATLSDDRVLAGFIGTNGLNASIGSYLVVDENAALPEPSSIVMLMIGLLSLAAIRLRKLRQVVMT